MLMGSSKLTMGCFGREEAAFGKCFDDLVWKP